MAALNQDMFTINQIAQHSKSDKEAWQKLYSTQGFSIDEKTARRSLEKALRDKSGKAQASILAALDKVSSC